MRCDVVWTGGLQNHINTSGATMANTARRINAEEVNCPKNATAARAITHPMERVAFMYLGCIMKGYRVCCRARCTQVNIWPRPLSAYTNSSFPDVLAIRTAAIKA